ncbi:ABC transporter permease subunit [Desulfoluna limicola]|uniref:ABC transporter permease subunit n=1 Tax=Desulfoluna limicola TaxID=2810562 RepID=UPI001F17713D|nr:ABC transporter permease subunit [Desulfoluna limicola]
MIILILSGLVMIMLSSVLGGMAVGGMERVVQSMGFWILGMWGLISAIYLGGNIILREIKEKTIYLILSRPISRTSFLLGKYLGILMVMATSYATLSGFLLFVMFGCGVSINSAHIWALMFIFGEWLLLAAITICLACFTTPLLHAFMMTGFYFIGHLSNILRIYSANSDELWMTIALKCLYIVIPNLEALNFRSEAIYNEFVPFSLLIEGAGVLGLWIVLFLVAAVTIFNERRIP